MPAGLARRPLSILKYTTGSTQIAIAGTLDSGGAPCYGWQMLPIYMRLAQAGTLEVYQRERGSSTWGLTDQWVLAGAGRLRTVVQLTGDHVRVLFTNGGVAQTPELKVALDV